MMIPAPYFLENEKWYIEIENKQKLTLVYELTELGKSIPKVKQSFDEYYRMLK